MKVELVEGWRVELPLVRSHVTAETTVTTRDIALIHIETDGVDGWGEGSPVPGYSAETIAEVWESTRHAAPDLLGRPAQPEAVPGDLLPASAAAALESAIWDASARQAGQPLWEFLGGEGGEVNAGATISLDAGISEVADALAAGYRHIKVKTAPGEPEQRLREIVARFPELSVGADANGSYRQAGEAEALDDLGLLYLEQPLPPGRLDDHAALAASMRTPICLDEDVISLAALHRAIDSDAADAFSIRAQRLGAVAAVLGAHAVAVVDGIPLRYGGMLESGVGRAHAVALAALPGFSLPSDLGASDRYLTTDVVSPPWAVADGKLVALDAPGIGVDVDRELVTALAIDHFSVS